MSILLYLSYALVFFSGVLMVSCTNPIHSVIFLILVFASASCIFMLSHVDFLGFVLLMIYVGAIAVLFIFVVMILNIKRIERDNTTYLVVGGFILVFFTLQLVLIFINSYDVFSPNNISLANSIDYEWYMFIDEFGAKHIVKLLGIQIFCKYFMALFISGTTLLVSLIGAVHLTSAKLGYSLRRQDNKWSRNSNLLNIHVY